MNDKIRCPNCDSASARCWDQRDHWYRSEVESFEVQMPVAYLTCLDCDTSYLHHDPASESLEDITDEINALG